MATLGQRIKQLRKEHNLTQEEFGKIFGIVKSTVSLYEHDKSIPDDSIKNMIADYFNVSIDYLLGRTDIRYPAKKTVDDRLKEVVGPYIASQIMDLQYMSQEERRTISIILEGLKARRQNNDGE